MQNCRSCQIRAGSIRGRMLFMRKTKRTFQTQMRNLIRLMASILSLHLEIACPTKFARLATIKSRQDSPGSMPPWSIRKKLMWPISFAVHKRNSMMMPNLPLNMNIIIERPVRLCSIICRSQCPAALTKMICLSLEKWNLGIVGESDTSQSSKPRFRHFKMLLNPNKGQSFKWIKHLLTSWFKRSITFRGL